MKNMMDDDTYVKAHRIVGSIQAAAQAVEMISVMPCDSRSGELLDLAKATLNKATLAAWEYADKLKPSEANRKD